ncbi:MAG TPA: methylated-DNA--[protein]-cysteine S-methyltransferase [Candidatus Baltobacteraceae bacterium]|jgi:methylated-DNA-[protein]-cysteine S-methyltransferase|nr:methylated-DNA--[protein]-cysteine S-methyltransferase [Candidatus Baltobacteraceae bacterium]
MTDESFAAATPVGTLWISARGDELIASDFRLSLRPSSRAPDNALLREARLQLRAYAGRRLRKFDLPLALRGTPFQVAVWQAVADLETGELVSYADVARAVGAPRAHRGVAMAMGRTPFDLFVPAHRVVGADGRIKGAGPQSLRRRLLAFEGITIGG